MHCLFSCLVMLFLVLAGTKAWATVTEATLYPNGATLVEELEATPAEGDASTLCLYIPASARESSINVTVPEAAVLSLSTRRLLDFEPDPRRAPLKKALLEAENALSAVNDEMAALEARRALWSWPNREAPTLAALEEIGAAMQTHLDQIAERMRALRQTVRERQDQLAALRNAWEKMGPSLLVMASLDRPVATPVRVRCEYYTKNASWKSGYRFNATPGEEKVSLALSATITQDTGLPWRDARIGLATLNPGGGVTPPAPRPWIVRPAPAAPAAGVRAAKMAPNVLMATASVEAAADGAAPEPHQMSHDVFAVWDIGSRSLPPATPVSVPLLSLDLKAAFWDVARPRLAETAFLMARVSIPGDAQLIEGDAVFLIDGALAGEGFFNPLEETEPDAGESGGSRVKEGEGIGATSYDIFFGPDVLVPCRYVDLYQASNQKGLLSKVQSRSWRWRMEVTNGRKTPVAVRLEDAAPQIRDERIKLRLVSQPEPARTENNLYVWKTELEPGKKFDVTCDLTLTAPEDLPFISTR